MIEGNVNSNKTIEGQAVPTENISGNLNQTQSIDGNISDSNTIEGNINDSQSLQGQIASSGAISGNVNQAQEINGSPNFPDNNYNNASNKPSINGVELIGNKTTKELNINVPTKLSELTNDADYTHKLSTNLEYYYTKAKVDEKINAISTGTVINIIDAFDYIKRFQDNEIYNANAVNNSVEWIILAILDAFNREVLIDINVQIDPTTYKIISIDKAFSDIKNAFELGGTTRVVAQLAGTNTKIILQLALLDSSVASFTTVMKANLGQGEMKYLLGINITERWQNVVIDVLS